MLSIPLLIALTSPAITLVAQSASPQLKITSFDGPVTEEELHSFNDYIKTLVPQDDNIGNKWAYGNSGYELRAMGVVYQISKQKETLDQMITFCDKSLSIRNDLAPAPVGQNEIWTGDIAPCWPNNNTTSPRSTGGEQGDPVGGLAYCATLMLKNDSLHDQTVPDDDPYGYGKTYLDRAKTYVKGADDAMTGHILSRLLKRSDRNRMYFADDCPYKPGQPVPWNQAVMFTYAFQYLVDAHDILGDNATLVQTYTDIMNANIEWFFADDGSTKKDGPKGRPIYVWDYTYNPDGGAIEDQTHAKMDFQGYYIAYNDGRWKVGADEMQPFANTFADVMDFGNGTYAGTVDGHCGSSSHSSCFTTLKQGYIYLAEFLPDKYEDIMKGANLAPGPTSTTLDVYSQFLWVKNLRDTGTAGNDVRWRPGKW